MLLLYPYMLVMYVCCVVYHNLAVTSVVYTFMKSYIFDFTIDLVVGACTIKIVHMHTECCIILLMFYYLCPECHLHVMHKGTD